MKKFFANWTKFEKGLMIVATALMIVLSFIWKDTPIGTLSAVTGVISVVLCAKGRVSNYVFGMVYVTAYAYVAFQNKLYGEVMMNLLYYVPMNVIGFITWTKLAKKKAESAQTGDVSKDVETRHKTHVFQTKMDDFRDCSCGYSGILAAVKIHGWKSCAYRFLLYHRIHYRNVSSGYEIYRKLDYVDLYQLDFDCIVVNSDAYTGQQQHYDAADVERLPRKFYIWIYQLEKVRGKIKHFFL